MPTRKTESDVLRAMKGEHWEGGARIPAKSVPIALLKAMKEKKLVRTYQRAWGEFGTVLIELTPTGALAAKSLMGHKH